MPTYTMLVVLALSALLNPLGHYTNHFRYTEGRPSPEEDTPEFVLSPMDGSNQTRPALAYNEQDHQYLAVWIDDRNMLTGSGLDLYGQVLDKDGHRLGEDFPICTELGTQDNPAVVFNPEASRFLVVWTDARNTSSGEAEIYGQIVDADGQLLDENFPIARAADFSGVAAPAGIYNRRDSYYLVAFAGRNSAQGGVFGQRIEADGRRPSDPFVLTPTTARPSGPITLAYNSTDNQYLVAWQDGRSVPTNGPDIYGQIVAADGRRLGNEIAVAAWPKDQRTPRAAYNSTNNTYLVTYLDNFHTVGGGLYTISGHLMKADGTTVNRYFDAVPPVNGIQSASVVYSPAAREYLIVYEGINASGDYDVYAARVDPIGFSGGRFPLTTAPRHQRFPALAFNGADGEYMAVWQDQRDVDERGYDLYVQRVNGSGVLQGENVRVSPEADPGPTPSMRNPGHPSLVYNPRDQQYLLVWHEYALYGGSGQDIYGRFLSPDGQEISDPFPICTALNSQYNPVVAYNSTDNEYLVVWQDGRAGSALFAQRVASDGSLPSPAIPISRYGGYAVVAYDAGGNRYLIVWSDSRNGPLTGADVYGQIVEADGRLPSGNFLISAAPGDQLVSSMVYNEADGEYLVVWSDTRDLTTRGLDLYAQRVRPDGVLLDSEFAISTAPDNQQSPVVVYNRVDEEYLVTWHDYRARLSSGVRVYGQRVAKDGRLLDAEFIIVPESSYIGSATVAYGEAENSYLVLWSARREGRIEEELYGRRVGADGRWLSDILSISSGDGSRESPTVAYGAAGGRYLSAWQDSRFQRTHGLNLYGRFIE